MKQQKLAVSVSEAAKMLGIGQRTLYRAINDGTVPHLAFGKRLVIPIAALEKWMEDESAKSLGP